MLQKKLRHAVIGNDAVAERSDRDYVALGAVDKSLCFFTVRQDLFCIFIISDDRRLKYGYTFLFCVDDDVG